MPKACCFSRTPTICRPPLLAVFLHKGPEEFPCIALEGHPQRTGHGARSVVLLVISVADGELLGSVPAQMRAGHYLDIVTRCEGNLQLHAVSFCALGGKNLLLRFDVPMRELRI